MTLVETHPRETARPPSGAVSLRPSGPRVWADMTVEVALSVLDSSRAGRLLLCDEDGRCTGTVSRAELSAARDGARYTDRTQLRDIVHSSGPSFSL
ncbi:hypothetical protein CG723_00785 [Streptomyces sp. CB01635]|nr:hypothetical protein CG723_00785 [Streptomyces sp. CB01635]